MITKWIISIIMGKEGGQHFQSEPHRAMDVYYGIDTDLVQVRSESSDGVNEGGRVTREGRLNKSLGRWSSACLSFVVRDTAFKAIQHLSM